MTFTPAAADTIIEFFSATKTSPNDYDRIFTGGSDCGCSASVLCTHILNKLKAGEYKKILFCATGALLSPTTVQQGENIPSIAHIVEIKSY